MRLHRSAQVPDQVAETVLAGCHLKLSVLKDTEDDLSDDGSSRVKNPIAYRAACRTTNSLINSSRNQFHCQRVVESRDNPRHLWNSMKTFVTTDNVIITDNVIAADNVITLSPIV